MKDLIMGCVTGYNYNQIKPWVVSLKKSGFKGEKIMIVYNASFDTCAQLEEDGFRVYGFNKNEISKDFIYGNNFGPQIVVTRFFHIWQLLKQLNEADYRYVITTDVKDVLFQSDPVLWLEKNLGSKKLNAASESINYKNEDWSNSNMKAAYGPNLYEFMSDKTIYNAGTISGCFDVVRDLALNVYLVSKYGPVHNPDQSAYNIILNLEPFRSITKFTSADEGWACQAGTTVDPSKINKYRSLLSDREPIMENGIVYTSDGLKYAIVHQYDRVPEWKKKILSRLNDL